MKHSQHGESVAIAARQQQINDMWQRMMQLKLDREKTLEGASRFVIKLFRALENLLNNFSLFQLCFDYNTMITYKLNI